MDGLGEDNPVWVLKSNCEFSINSASNLIKEFREVDDNDWLKKLWKWEGPK